VLKAHEGPGRTKYSVDVRVVRAGTLEDTEQVISEVPLSPVWVGQKKRGLYAIPPQGQIIIVEFLGWNPAYPFVAGIWSDDYEADEFRAGQFVITSGEGMKITLDPDGGKITVENGSSKMELEDGKITADNGTSKVIADGGNITVEAGTKATVKAATVEITGGALKVKGTAAPGAGPFCAIPNCLFTGAPHSGEQVAGT
jgi:phage baseplate assembly protein gpV